jgi:hypothetical protein
MPDLEGLETLQKMPFLALIAGVALQFRTDFCEGRRKSGLDVR